MWSISWQDLEFLPNTCLIEIWKRGRLSHSSCINPHIGHAIQISLWTVRKIQTMLEGTIKICLVFVLNHKTKYIKADPSPAVRTSNEIDMALSQQRFGLSYVVTNFPESFVQVPTSKFHLLFHCFTFCCYLHFSLSLFTFQEFQEYLVHHFWSKQHLWTDKVK